MTSIPSRSTAPVEAAVSQHWRINRLRPYRRKLILAIARFIDATPGWLERYQYPIALLGLLSGVASYWLIDRQPALAAGIAIAALVGWGLLLLEALVLSSIPNTRWSKAGTGVFQITLQTIHQEALFFVVTFAVLSTNWQSGHVLFTGLIIALTAAASIDPIYHFTLARSRIALLSFHAITMFFCSFLALPIALQIPLDEALLYSLGFTVLVTWPLMYKVSLGNRLSRLLQSSAILLLVAGGIWAGRGLLPPMSTQLNSPAVSAGFDLEHKTPLNPKKDFLDQEIRETGLYAYTPIKAPLGLNQGVIHEWRLNGELIDSIPMEITGGRSSGYRAWSYKENFPDDPNGHWKITVRTPRGIVLGNVTIDVKATPPNTETNELDAATKLQQPINQDGPLSDQSIGTQEHE